MERTEKAWVINPKNFKEPHFAPEDVFYAETESKAKSKALSQIRYDDYLDRFGDPINFLSLRIRRAKLADKYLIDGQIKTMSQIKYHEEVRLKNERIDKLVSENPDAKAYIRKRRNYYCSNYCGYTEFLTNAGVYAIQDAARCVKGCSLDDHMQLIVINDEEHNKMINEKIEELKTKLI